MLSKEVLKQKHGDLLGKWSHWFPNRGKVAYCGYRRNRTGHHPNNNPNCPTCEEFHRREGSRGWN